MIYLRYLLLFIFFNCFICSSIISQFVSPDNSALIFSERGERNKRTRKQGNKGFTNRNKRSQPKVVRFDHVRNIRIRIINNNNNNILLSWEPVIGVDDEYVLVRYKIPIASEKILKSSKVLAIKTFKTSVHLDKSIVKGVHYYAVVRRNKIDADKGIELVPDMNFTTVPVIVSDEGIRIGYNSVRSKRLPIKTFDTPATDLIKAKLVALDGHQEEPYVKVSWLWSGVDAQSLFIYRSNELISSIDMIKRAIRIREVSPGVDFFDDYEIHRDRKYYYAITGKDLQNIERIILEPNISFTTKPVKLSSKDSIPLTRFISASKVSENLVLIEWKDIIPSLQRPDLFYSLYRSTKPILSIGGLAIARKIATFTFNQLIFQDYINKSGEYFYALVTESTQGQQNKTFLGNINTTLVGVNITANKKDLSPEVSDTSSSGILKGTNRLNKNLSIHNVQNTSEQRIFASFSATQSDLGVYLSWDYFIKRRFLEKNFSHILLYRFGNKPEGQSDFENGVFITKLNLSQKSYTDKVEGHGKRFYSIFLYDNTSEEISPHEFISEYNMIGPILLGYASDTSGIEKEPSLEKGRHLALPQIKSKEDHNLQNGRLSNVKVKKKDLPKVLKKLLQETFFKKDYTKALKDISFFVEDNSNLSEKLYSKALFYTGLSFFYLKNYDRATKYLQNNIVKKYYTERSKFWLEQIKVSSL